MTSIFEAEAALVRMTEMNHQAQAMLAAQKLAAGDDTACYRRSLINFVLWFSDMSSAEAERAVDDYLYEHRALNFPQRARRRFRRIIGGKVDLKATPEQLAAAWKCFVGNWGQQ